MQLADTLSRAPNAGTPPSEGERELETVCAVETSLPDPHLQKVAAATARDVALQEVIELIQKGWPEDKRKVSQAAKPYHSVRDELVVHNGVVFKGDRCVIPQSMRAEVLRQLHSAHMGVESTLRRARETVYWPWISAEIRDLVTTCDTCQTHATRQQKESLMPHDPPKRPWEKVGVDLFTFSGRDYIIQVDYLTNYWEVDFLNGDTRTATVVNKMKAQFARHGIPSVVFSDNGPQFTSELFQKFSEAWGFTHQTASPHYPQSNGKAESAVKTAKNIMQKAIHAGIDGWKAILEYRNTPTQQLNTSPVQRFYGRRTRGALPQRSSLLEPERVSMRGAGGCSEAAKRAYDRRARDLPPLPDGTAVFIQPQQRRAPWIKGTVERTSGPRSYDVRTEAGVYRRNRRQLRARHTDSAVTSTAESADTAEENDWRTQRDVNPPEESAQDEERGRMSDSGEEAMNENAVTRTRSGRVVYPPVRFRGNEFVRY